MSSKTPKKPLNSQEAKLVKYLSSVKEEDIFPEKKQKGRRKSAEGRSDKRGSITGVVHSLLIRLLKQYSS